MELRQNCSMHDSRKAYLATNEIHFLTKKLRRNFATQMSMHFRFLAHRNILDFVDQYGVPAAGVTLISRVFRGPANWPHQRARQILNFDHPIE